MEMPFLPVAEIVTVATVLVSMAFFTIEAVRVAVTDVGAKILKVAAAEILTVEDKLVAKCPE